MKIPGQFSVKINTIFLLFNIPGITFSKPIFAVDRIPYLIGFIPMPSKACASDSHSFTGIENHKDRFIKDWKVLRAHRRVRGGR